ncbi:MAG: tetratricopeptide repeat protein, partial [Nitrospira sp.]|nr:tetratricopeptide repeat protein [Nitrospira sp.]
MPRTIIRINHVTHLQMRMVYLIALYLVFSITGCQGIQSTAKKSECVPGLIHTSCFYEREKPGKRNKLILFVHGVIGSANTTWGNPPNENFWPAMVRGDSPRFEDYDIYLFNYRTAVRKRSPNIHEIAVNELAQLKSHEVFEQYTDIHFIAHSMGGLVVKSMLVALKSGDEEDLLQQVKSVNFLATPAQGATIARIAAFFSSNPQFRNMESAHMNAFIQSLEDRWVQLLIARDETKAKYPRAYCAYETLPTKGVLLVPREMATSRCDGPPQPLPFNHESISIANDPEEDPYLWVMKNIRDADHEGRELQKTQVLLLEARNLRKSGHNEEARDPYNQALSIFKGTNDRLGEATVIKELGGLERILGHSDEARTAYIKAQTLFKAEGHLLGEAEVLAELGELERLLGHPDKARTAYDGALTLYKREENWLGQAFVLHRLGDLENQLGNVEKARIALSDARDLF